jgi:serine/threonine protein kinase
VLHQIGVGALGPVFRTYEPERDRLVAVKAFRLDITPEQAQTLADELSRAADAGLFHPSIVEPIAAGVQGTVAYNAEEYVAAESLDSAMKHYAPAPITTVLPFITQLAGAIDFARVAGVGHGALHPRDIFVTPEEARATGFGVVEALERVGFRAPVRRPYSPPERIAGAAWTTAADVFSLAAITYEMLTARRPSGLGREIGTLTAGTPNAWMDALHAVLARAMDPEPSARFATALGFASALEAAARGGTSDATLPMARPIAGPMVAPVATALPAVDSAATILSARPAGSAPVIDRTADRRQTEEEDLSHSREAATEDLVAEQLDDETDYQLRLSERHDPFHRDPAAPLDEDIEVEAEADRFVGDDFLLGAAGAASAAPARPYDLRARDLPIDADPSDTLLDARALEDDEVAVDEAPSPAFKPQDLLNDETIRRPRPDDGRYGAIPVAAARIGGDAPPSSERSPLRAVVMLIVGLAAGLVGGYAVWGRGSGAPAATTATAANSGSGSGASTPASGREFSEQAVTPPAPPATSARAPSAGPGGTPGAPTADPGARSGAAAKAAAAASAGSLVVRSTPSGAGVTLNGRWRGRTPLTLDDLPFRRYEVRVVQPGFTASTETVVLSSDAPARSLSLQLQPQSAGARARPAAPAEAPAAAPRTATRPAAPRQEPQSPTVYTGSIYVDSRPRGARVTVDGKPVGVTPVRVADVRIGTHVVRLELPDHRWWSTTTRVTSGQEQRVTGSLERIQ